MHRRVLVTLVALLLSGFVGAYIGAQSPAVTAQAVTPVPGRHSEVHAAFPFLVKDAPSQMGWRLAEYKDEYGRQFWKADVLPGCGEWQTVPGDVRPGLLLTPGGADCPGFVIAFGVLYGWNEPPITTPTMSPPTGTVAPPFDGATATPPSPTVTGGVTATPSPQREATVTPTHPIMTITPTPMFPQFPTCATQVLLYRAGDPAQGGLGGKVGSVSWCGSCNSGCGVWMLGVDKATMDGFANDARERVRQVWATATIEAR